MGAFLRVIRGARSPRVRVALRAATFFRDDGEELGCNGHANSPARTLRVSRAQHKYRADPQPVPFGSTFDTELSREWNA
jgi:hypothetical protein